LGKACEIVSEEFSDTVEHLQHVTESLLHGLLDISEIKLNSEGVFRLPNTINISIKGIYADEFVERLAYKVAISAGSACHAGIRRASNVLVAMGLSEDEALSSVRISTGKFTTEDEIIQAQEIIKMRSTRL